MIETVLANLTVTEIYSVNRLLKSPVGVMTDRKNRSNWALALKMKGKTYYYTVKAYNGSYTSSNKSPLKITDKY